MGMTGHILVAAAAFLFSELSIPLFIFAFYNAIPTMVAFFLTVIGFTVAAGLLASCGAISAAIALGVIELGFLFAMLLILPLSRKPR